MFSYKSIRYPLPETQFREQSLAESIRYATFEAGPGDGARTRDLLFSYTCSVQLSYAGDEPLLVRVVITLGRHTALSTSSFSGQPPGLH
jgi:hypothetical protein